MVKRTENSPEKGLFYCLSSSLEKAFFLECSYSLGREYHSDFFTINHKCLFLKIRPENSFGATQAKTHVVSVLFAFAC